MTDCHDRWLARLREAVVKVNFGELAAMAYEMDELPRVPRWRTVALLRATYHLTVERWHDYRKDAKASART